MSKYKEKIRIHAKVVEELAQDQALIDIVKKSAPRIVIPSSHLGFFRTIYAHIGVANRNGVILSREAVENSIDTLIQSQVNFEHFRKGNICGQVMDAWINADDAIEIVFAFHKGVYEERFEEAKDKLSRGELNVSFELLSDKSTQQFTEAGVVLNDVDFQGVGFLFDHDPADPEANVLEMAKLYLERAEKIEDRELVFANKIIDQCNEALGNKEIHNDFTLNIDKYGNGEILETIEDQETVTHQVENFEVKDSNTDHKSMNKALKAFREAYEIADQNKLKEDEKGGNKFMNEDQIKLLNELRAEFGDNAKDLTDEDLLNEEKVAELRKSLAQKSTSEVPEEEETPEETPEETEETPEEPEEETEEEASTETEEASVTEEVTKKTSFDVQTNEDGTEVMTETLEQKVVTTFATIEEAQAKITELEAKVEELEATIVVKDSDIEAVRAEAEKIGKRKVELSDNIHAKDFTDEDYLNEDKVEKAQLRAKNDELQKALDGKPSIKAPVNASLETGVTDEEPDARELFRRIR